MESTGVTLMALVKLDIHPLQERRILFSEGKNLISLPKRMGLKGDIFRVGSRFFRLSGSRPYILPVEEIANRLYLNEGYVSTDDFLKDLGTFYPELTFEDTLRLHWYKEISLKENYGEIARLMYRRPTEPFKPHLVNIVKTPTSRYTRKTTNGVTPKQKSPDRRCKEYKMGLLR